MATQRNRQATTTGHMGKQVSKSMGTLPMKVANQHSADTESHQNHARLPRRSSGSSHRVTNKTSSRLPPQAGGNVWQDCVGGAAEHDSMRRLLLLHLELIQQLQEQIKAKDAELTRIVNERDQMAVKVERMERRMVLLQKKSSSTCTKTNTEACIRHKQDSTDSDDCDILEKTNSFGNMAIQNKRYRSSEKKENFRIVNVEPNCGLILSANIHKTSKATLPLQTTVNQMESLTSETLHEMSDRWRGQSAKPICPDVSVDSSNPSTPASGVSNCESLSPMVSLEHYNGRDCGNEIPVAQPEREVNCIRTRFLSILHEGTYRGHDIDEMDIQKASQDPTIKVPKWRSMDGCRLKTKHARSTTYPEDLSDNTYLKRHNKSEAEEKRIKRWDIRRIREQRQQEALKRRYSNGNVPKVKCVQEGEETTVTTFLPNPNDLQSLEVEDDIVVSAFGQPLPLLPEREFGLPWFHVRSRNTVTQNARTRKKLKGRVYHKVT